VTTSHLDRRLNFCNFAGTNVMAVNAARRAMSIADFDGSKFRLSSNS
jgi:hypothetical protein